MQEELDSRIITDPTKLPDIFGSIDQSREICFDAETTGLDVKRDQVKGLALAIKGHEWYVCQEALTPALASVAEMSTDPSKLWIAHNARFDWHMLHPHGFKPYNIIDTIVAAWLVDENEALGLKHQAHLRLTSKTNEYLSYLKDLPFEIKSLMDLPEFKDLLKATKPVKGVKRMDQVLIDDIPLKWLGPYGVLDGRMGFDLWQVLKYHLHQEDLEDIFWNTKIPIMRVIFEMEHTGVWIDQERLSQVENDYIARQEQALLQWEQLSGGLNPNSHPQVREYLYNKLGYKVSIKTAGGLPSTAELALLRMLPRDDDGEIIRDPENPVSVLLDIRKMGKMLDTYIGNYKKVLFNGRINTNFNQCGTVTGRWSSSHATANVNLQNVPSKGEYGAEIRSFFSAPPGYSLGVYDESQIELRWLAHYTKDENLLAAYKVEGSDIHQMTSDQIGIPRKYAKNVNFLSVYGGGPRVLADNIEKAGLLRPSEKDARAWLKAFYEKAYPGIKPWQNDVIHWARRLGYVKTITGRKRRLPNINHHDNAIRGSEERRAVNAIIQGSAADTLELAILKMRPYVNFHGGKMLFQVHDEVGFESPIGNAKKIGAYVKRCLEEVGKELGCQVPLKADGGVGGIDDIPNNWAELH
jgi:DNA polymerase I